MDVKVLGFTADNALLVVRVVTDITRKYIWLMKIHRGRVACSELYGLYQPDIFPFKAGPLR